MQKLAAALTLILLPPVAGAQHVEPQPAAPPEPCVLTGSSDVFAEGRSMLRLSDVSGCDPRTYEIIPSVFVNGEPAVRLLADPETGDAPGGAASVLVDDQPANRLGDR